MAIATASTPTGWSPANLSSACGFQSETFGLGTVVTVV